MTLEEMDVEYFLEHAEEVFALAKKEGWTKPNKDVLLENPYGAGGFGFIRSAKRKKALVYKELAEWDPVSKRWFESVGGSFSCGADENAEEDWYALDRQDYDSKRPHIAYKEAYYHFRYGRTKAEVAECLFLLIEKNGHMVRTFSFDLENVTVQELKEYKAAVEEWHRTGELNIGDFRGEPHFGSWRKE